MASARAIATRCCCPPESCAGYLAACWPTPTRSSSSRALASASAGLRPRTLIGPRVTFSRIVLWANRLKLWNTMPTSARRLASSLPSWGSGVPSRLIAPWSIVSSRLIARHSVDLPEPDGPMTTTTSPRATVRSMSRRTCSSPNHLLTPSSTTRGAPTVGSAVAVSETTITRTYRRRRRPGHRASEISGAARPA